MPQVSEENSPGDGPASSPSREHEPSHPVSTTPPVHAPYKISWRERLIVLGSVFAAILCAWSIGYVHAREATLELTALLSAGLFAIGKFLPLWGISGKSHFTPWELALAKWGLDTWSPLMIIYALDALYRVPVLGRALVRMQHNASIIVRAYPRLQSTAIVGLVLFVSLPVTGTGAVVGAFIGALLGLHRAVLIAAISAGGLLGGLIMAFAAVHFGQAMEDLRQAQADPAIRWIIIGAGVMVLAGLFLWVNRAYRRALASARAML